MNRAQRRAAARTGVVYRVKRGAHKGEVLSGEQAVLVGQLINRVYNDRELKAMSADHLSEVTDWAVDAILEARGAHPDAEVMSLLHDTEDLYRQKLEHAGKRTFDDQAAADLMMEAGEQAYEQH